MSRHRHLIAIDSASAAAGPRVTITYPTSADRAWFRVLRETIEGLEWSRMSAAARSVLIVLSAGVNESELRKTGRWLAWPGLPVLCKRAGYKRRTVLNALAELADRGLLARHRAGRRAVRYELHPILPEVHDSAPQDAGRDSVEVHCDAPQGVRSRCTPMRAEVHAGALRGARWCTHNKDDKEFLLKNSDNSMAAAVFASLVEDGRLDARDPARLSALAEHDVSRCRRALDLLADYVRRGKLNGTTYGFLAAAIRDNWSPTAGVAQVETRRRSERAARERMIAEREEYERQQRAYEGRVLQIRERLLTMAPGDVQLLVSDTLAGLQEFARDFTQRKGLDPQSNDALAFEIGRHMGRRLPAGATK